jgi:hypothetical protein
MRAPMPRGLGAGLGAISVAGGEGSYGVIGQVGSAPDAPAAC